MQDAINELADQLSDYNRRELDKAIVATDECPVIEGLAHSESPDQMVEFLTAQCPLHLRLDKLPADPYAIPEVANNQANIAIVSPHQTIYFVYCTIRTERSRWPAKLQVAFAVKSGSITEVCVISRGEQSPYQIAIRLLLRRILHDIMRRFHRPAKLFNRNSMGTGWQAKLKYAKMFAVHVQMYSKLDGIVHRVAKLTEIDTVPLHGVRVFGFVLPAIGEFRLTVVEQNGRRHYCYRAVSPVSTTSIVDGTTSIINEQQYESFLANHARRAEQAQDVASAMVTDPYFMKDIGENE